MTSLRPVVLLLVVAVGGLGALAYFQQNTIRQQQGAIEQLQTASEATVLDLQEKCAKQAREMFKADGWDKQPLAGFGNHYNAAMNKCFVVIENTSLDTSGVETITKILLDAFEGSAYGQYIWFSNKVKPFLCYALLASREKKLCQSKDEFDEMLRNYMGEDFHD
jgi:hypothetical protein